MSSFFAATFVTLTALAAAQAQAADLAVINLICKDGVFTPADVQGPANVKFKLIVKNEGSSAEEFESHELNREKVIAPGQSATIFIGPLPAGTYPFFGEFHPKTAQGKLILK